MTTIKQLRLEWYGFKGAPGVSTFYSQTDQDVTLSHLKTFFDAIKTSIPPTVGIKYPTAGVTIDSITGQPNGNWSSAPRSDTGGAGGTAYAAPIGAVVNWNTGVFANGRQVRGKTFIVPMSNASFDVDGTLSSTILTSLRTLAAALCGPDDPIVIWGKTSGVVAPAVSVSVPDKAVVLRSRRD